MPVSSHLCRVQSRRHKNTEKNVTTKRPDLFPFVDLALSRRLERAEAVGNAEFVEARATLYPDSGARWIEVAGAYAMFDGVRSPCTQTFGLGVFQTCTHSDLETIEDFYRDLNAPVFHEVSPLVDSSLMTLLNERGYQPIELTSVMFRPIEGDAGLAESRNENIRVRVIEPRELVVWAETMARGWSDSTEFADLLFEFGRIGANRPNAFCFLAELGGQPIAAGSMSICDGVALMAGASTIPEARKQGAQLAVLDARLRIAAQRGCDIAMMCALPGSASQRNAERHGFRIAYTRIKWQLAQQT